MGPEGVKGDLRGSRGDLRGSRAALKRSSEGPEGVFQYVRCILEGFYITRIRLLFRLPSYTCFFISFAYSPPPKSYFLNFS